jgi:hypothetical protein
MIVLAIFPSESVAQAARASHTVCGIADSEMCIVMISDSLRLFPGQAGSVLFRRAGFAAIVGSFAALIGEAALSFVLWDVSFVLPGYGIKKQDMV